MHMMHIYKSNEYRSMICRISQKSRNDSKITRMVVHEQLVEPAVCLSDLYDVFLLDIVRDTKQNSGP